jgi:RNA polymerase sigma factor (sigma-70 family)
MPSLKHNQIIWNNFRKGDKHALELIYDGNYSALIYYGLKFTTDKNLLKDLVHELFEDLINSGERLSQTDNIRFYLLKAFRNKLLKKLSGVQLILKDQFDGSEFDIVDSVEHQLIKNEVKETIHQKIISAINKLSAKQKEIIYLRFYNDMDYPEIAELFGVNIQTVRNLMHRAIRSLKDDFMADGINSHIILFLLQLPV